jgi:hypothetical protein
MFCSKTSAAAAAIGFCVLRAPEEPRRKKVDNSARF